jgi:membrane protease YdiL (CAAX protease family)
MRTVVAGLRRRPLTGFFLIAFGSSWAWLGVTLGVLGLPAIGAVATVATFVGPTLAAVVCSAAVGGRAGVLALLRRYVLWRVAPRWYLLAVLCWPVVFLGAAAAARPGAFQPPAPAFLLGFLGAFGFVLVLGGPLGEEPGWRGFALPGLQRRLGPLAGTLLLGTLHGLWHLPVYLLVPGYNGAPGDLPGILGAFGRFVAAVAVGAVLITWVFNNTRGSLLPVVLLHASTNTAGVLPMELFPGLVLDLEAIRSAAQLAIAVAIVLLTRARLSYDRYLRETADPVLSPR